MHPLIRKLTMAVLIGCAGISEAAPDKYQPAVPESAVATLASAKARYSQTKGASDAIATLSALTQAQPNYYAAHYNLGLVLADEGRYDEAIASLVRARQIREQEGIRDATIYNSLGWAYMLKGDPRSAESSFLVGKQNEALLSKDSKARLYNNMGWLYMSTGKFEASRSALVVAEQQYDSDTARSNLEVLRRVESRSKAAAPR